MSHNDSPQILLLLIMFLNNIPT